MPTGPWNDGETVTQHHDGPTGAWETTVGAGLTDYSAEALVGSGSYIAHESRVAFGGDATVFSTDPAVDMSVAAASNIAWEWAWARSAASVNWDGSSHPHPAVTNADPTPSASGSNPRVVGHEYSFTPTVLTSDFCQWSHFWALDRYIYAQDSGWTPWIGPTVWPDDAIGIEFEGDETDPVTFTAATLLGYGKTSQTGTPTPQMYAHLAVPNLDLDGEAEATVYYWPSYQWGDPVDMTSDSRLKGPAGATASVDILDLVTDMFTVDDPLSTIPDRVLEFQTWDQAVLADSGIAPHSGTSAAADYVTVSEPTFSVTFVGQRYRFVYPLTIGGAPKDVRRRFVG